MKKVPIGVMCLAFSCCNVSTAAVLQDSLAMIARCAPKVDAETLGAIVRTESGGHVFVLSDDGPSGMPWQQRKKLIRSIYPGTFQEAADLARKLIGDGHLVGIGLTQINSRNLAGLGVSIEQLLDPCMNLAVGARVLRSLFQQALRSGRYATRDRALGAAVSAYNTGSFSDGFSNGYVAKVLANMGAGIPQLSSPPAQAGKISAAYVYSAAFGKKTERKNESDAWKARVAPLDVNL